MKDVTRRRHSEDQQVQRQEVEGAAEAIDYGKGVPSCPEHEGSLCRVVRQYSGVFEFPVCVHVVPSTTTNPKALMTLWKTFAYLLWHKGLGSDLRSPIWY